MTPTPPTISAPKLFKKARAGAAQEIYGMPAGAVRTERSMLSFLDVGDGRMVADRVEAAGRNAPCVICAAPSIYDCGTLTAAGYNPPAWCAKPQTAFGRFLLVMHGTEMLDTIPICERPFYVAGRSEQCELQLNHPSTSRRHAAVLHHPSGDVFIVDLGSVHGTFLDGRRLAPRELAQWGSGISVVFGGSSRSFWLQSDRLHSSQPLPSDPLSGGRAATRFLAATKMLVTKDETISRLAVDGFMAAAAPSPSQKRERSGPFTISYMPSPVREDCSILEERVSAWEPVEGCMEVQKDESEERDERKETKERKERKERKDKKKRRAMKGDRGRGGKKQQKEETRTRGKCSGTSSSD
eukprot:CAMPEP_0119321566 /NCGR_PEP_ID=MMETSP1333-20130426/55737_1 /TAXON_ID=418940 /ORGANISM="Scyphosphaera apsteinii, Strain RCC1455" /LENGTH=353 /DNA_ID=CAMNT_0007328569 /DNA_START=165 /DNA_END=1226 /DNA_ORIENTATION=-